MGHVVENSEDSGQKTNFLTISTFQPNQRLTMSVIDIEPCEQKIQVYDGKDSPNGLVRTSCAHVRYTENDCVNQKRDVTLSGMDTFASLAVTVWQKTFAKQLPPTMLRLPKMQCR